MGRTPISKFRRATARRLRNDATGAEILLWRQLRQLEIQGTHFRRQVPIGRYVVDFACMAERLVIEVDGSQHGNDDTRSRDDARTQWLESEGYRVLRFWNNEISGNIDSVLAAINDALHGVRDSASAPLRHRRRTVTT
jgi:very-short-patch-repair endonuclease